VETGEALRKVALVLGGGGARGIAHINVIEAFDDLGVRPSIIVGSSIGAIMGAAYASGMSGAQIRQYAIDAFGNRAHVMARLWRLRPDSLQALFNGPPRLGEFDAQRVMRAFLPREIPETFAELQIPLKVTATDFYGNSTTVIENGELWRALAASSAIPALFRPVIVNGRVHVDGGISDPVAFDLVDGSEFVIVAVDVIGKPSGDPSKLPSRIEAAFGSSQLMMQALMQYKLRLNTPDLLIRPAVGSYRVLDFLHTESILARTAPSRIEVREKLAAILEQQLDDRKVASLD
jgi:NTE family protein